MTNGLHEFGTMEGFEMEKKATTKKYQFKLFYLNKKKMGRKKMLKYEEKNDEKLDRSKRKLR